MNGKPRNGKTGKFLSEGKDSQMIRLDKSVADLGRNEIQTRVRQGALLEKLSDTSASKVKIDIDVGKGLPAKTMGPHNWKEAGIKLTAAADLISEVQMNYPLPKDMSNRAATAENKTRNLAYEFLQKWKEFKALCDLGK